MLISAQSLIDVLLPIYSFSGDNAINKKEWRKTVDTKKHLRKLHEMCNKYMFWQF